MAQKLGNFLTNREHAPQGYIYPCVNLPKDLVWLGKKERTQKNLRIWKICHLPDPPPFSLFSTFKKRKYSAREDLLCFSFQFEHAPGLFS